jgi:membrane protease YdiL (CAAX protease family)
MIQLVISIFWNDLEQRSRAGWRLAIQMFLFVMISLLAGILSVFVGDKSPSAPVVTALSLGLCLVLIWFVGCFLDRRRIKDYGYHLTAGWWLDFGFGLLLGAVLMSGVFLTERLAGWIEVTPPLLHDGVQAWGKAALTGVAFFFTVALSEEFMSRGYQLRNLAEGIAGRRVGPRTAIVAAWLISSCLFGLFHRFNPNATNVSTLNIMLAGILLGLPYILTGELAISIGLHLTWNLFQGTVYGFPVSGTRPTKEFLVLKQSGPDLWTGGKFGPEAGLLGIAAMIIGCALVVAWFKYRRRRVAIDVVVARYEPRWGTIPTTDALIAAQPPDSVGPAPHQPEAKLPTG